MKNTVQINKIDLREKTETFGDRGWARDTLRDTQDTEKSERRQGIWRAVG